MATPKNSNPQSFNRYTLFIILMVGAEIARIALKASKNWSTLSKESLLVLIFWVVLISVLIYSRYIRAKKKAEEMRVTAIINQAIKENSREYQEAQVTRKRDS